MSELIVNEKDLSLVEDNVLNQKQLQLLVKKTPAKYIKERPAKGGGKWKYVTGGYVKKMLNLMCGWDWDFQIIENQVIHGEVVVKGRLTCRINGRVIVKEQFGNKDIMYRKQKEGETERIPLSIGNDLKAASTDALKKCAAEIGIAADIYNPEEFREITVASSSDFESQLDEIKELYSRYSEMMKPEESEAVKRIIETNETNSYNRVLNHLQQLQKEIES